MGSVVSIENPALQSYAFYSSILVIKMLLMAPLTSMRRISRNNYASPEDYKMIGIKEKTDQIIPDPTVERVRRAHLNDLENIPAFMFISAIFLLTEPSPSLMNNLMLTYTSSRVIHTLVYAFREVRQPARGIAWFIGYGITLYMAGSVIYRFR